MKELLVGRMSITRTHTSEGSHVSITMRCDSSSAQFLRVEMGMQEFARCLMNESDIECKFKMGNLDKVGKSLEVKEELVQCDGLSLFDDNDALIKERMAPLEVDGWKGDNSDLFNHHRRKTSKNGPPMARVTFRRYV